jgi:hypothetical protein
MHGFPLDLGSWCVVQFTGGSLVCGATSSISLFISVRAKAHFPPLWISGEGLQVFTTNLDAWLEKPDLGAKPNGL